MIDALEELTPERVKDLTQAEAKALYDERKAVRHKMICEMEMLAPIAFPPKKPAPVIDADESQKGGVYRKASSYKPSGGKKCPHCGSDNTMPLKGGRIFCRACARSSEVT